MIKEYKQTWPLNGEFSQHCKAYLPYCVRQAPEVCNSTQICALLSNCSTEIDVSCISTSEEYFCGHLASRQHIRLKLCDISNGFQAVGISNHWTHSCSYDVSLYLSQFPIFTAEAREMSPICDEIKGCIRVPTILEHRMLSQVTLWMNMDVQTISSLHYDGYHNLLCVVTGKKTVRMCSGDYSRFLFPFMAFSGSANHSKQYRVFAEAVHRLPANAVLEVEVRSGEALFIPEGWWHEVVSDPATMAISFWFESGLMSDLHYASGSYGLRSACQLEVNRQLSELYDEAERQCQQQTLVPTLNSLEEVKQIVLSETARAVDVSLDTLLQRPRGRLIMMTSPECMMRHWSEVAKEVNPV